MENSYRSILDFLDVVENELRAAVPRHTGRLANSISSKLIKKQDKSEYTIEFEMEQYGWFQNEGVNGVGFKQTKGGTPDKRYKSNRPVVRNAPYSFRDKMPPASAFSGYTTSLSGQFAIAKSIYRTGIKGKHFIEPIIERAQDKLVDLVTEDLFIYYQEQIMNDKK